MTWEVLKMLKSACTHCDSNLIRSGCGECVLKLPSGSNVQPWVRSTRSFSDSFVKDKSGLQNLKENVSSERIQQLKGERMQ